MNKITIFIILLVTILASGYFLLPKKMDSPVSKVVTEMFQSAPKNIDLEASFDIYTNGTKRIFTDPKYHNLSPDVFIEVDNPDLVRVKKTGITWNDFFKTLPMKLTKECLITGTKQSFCTGESRTLRFYINEIEDPNALDKQIKEGDKLLVKYGK